MNNIAGFVSFGKQNKVAFIDGWATVILYRGKGIGAAMLRWAETWARSNKCNFIRLWAYEDTVEIYRRFGYDFVGGQELILSETQKYKLMGKKILYNTKMIDLWE